MSSFGVPPSPDGAKRGQPKPLSDRANGGIEHAERAYNIFGSSWLLLKIICNFAKIDLPQTNLARKTFDGSVLKIKKLHFGI